MFYLYHHHDLARLAELQAALLERRSAGHPLTPDTVIVPNRGVGRWLQMQLAEHQGVAANLALPLLARFIWQIVPGCLDVTDDASPFARTRLRWHIYAVLPDVARDEPAVASYLAGEPRAVHRMQLAERLADVFDQYLIYRPQLLADWDAGRIRDGEPDRWQALVWQALTRRLGSAHRAALLHRFIAAAEDGTLDTSALPATVYCFGLDQLPPDYVRFLYALSQHVDVHFLLPNPCDGYWGDIQHRRSVLDAPPPESPAAGEQTIEAGHPLLASLGKCTRDFLRVLYADELAAIQEPELGTVLAYEPPADDALLARVQTGIIGMRAPRDDTGMANDDASVQIHACHGPLREIQVLQDQLLDLLSRIPDLQPRDIVVMVPDVTTYAPAIRSVFGAATGRRHLPYSISDRSRAASHPIMQSFRQLLELPLSRWAASDILALASVPAIMRRFDLDEAALATATDWVQAAGVRWGFDAQTRATFGAAEIEQNTWRFGLDRLLLGAVQSDDQALVAGVAPWSDLEGGATASLGSLWHLVEQLHAWSRTLETPATPAAWHERLNTMIEALFRADPDDMQEQTAVEELHAAIGVLGEAADALDEEPLSWHAVREVLGGELAAAGERQPFLSGGVTFCGLTPLRGVPFRVVCLLGLDDGVFPRQESNRAFNALRSRPRLGDHDVRDDDRLLFLQSIMAARDVFYISYTGRDAASGDALPPSPVVGEWQDFLHRHYFAGWPRQRFEDRLITPQPMHPFSQRLFEREPTHPRLFTFAHEWQPASRAGHQSRTTVPAFIDGAQAPAPEDAEVIELGALRRFFDHPAQSFLQGRLQLDFETLDDAVDDREPLQLDGLTGWQIRNALLDNARRDDAASVPTQPDALWRARGLLPPPPLDIGPFAAQAEQVNALLPVWRSWTRDDEQPGCCDIDLTVGDQRLRGRISNVWPDGPRLMRPGSLRMKYRLRTWIDYLVFRAAGHEGSLRLAGIDGDGNAIEFGACIDPDVARDHLAALLTLFERGQREPLIFLPDLADAYLEARDKKDDAAAALDKINNQLTNTFQPPPPVLDPYFAPLLASAAPLGTEPGSSTFCELAETVCGPPHRHIAASEEATP